jgi:Leucine-rich repeat (LRR) protein
VKDRVTLILIAVMLALSVGLVGCGQPAAAAVVSESEGYLTVKEGDTADWTEAEVGMALEPTDIIRCGLNSSAEITFLNGDTVELGPGTELEVAELSISTETDSAIIRLKLVIGSIVFRVVNIVDPSSRYEVESPTGEVAIRGSAVQITVSEDGTTLVCNLEGDIWAIAQGVELPVPEGECCVIGSGQPPQLVVIFADSNLEAAIREAISKPTGDIYPSDLQELTRLDAWERNITDLTGLEHATSLTDLNLQGNPISDISALANLTDLTGLVLWHTQIGDISPLANLTNLTDLFLTVDQTSDISPLASLTNLAILWLTGNQISDISPLANLTSLTSLLLVIQTSDVSPLANLTNLTGLTISDSPVSDISSLASLTNLAYLNLYNNQIGGISSLANLTSLTQLRLYDNQISEVSALTDLTSLTELSLYNNQVSDISALANLTSLTLLYLHDNQISDISPLANLTSLTELTLHDNQISDVSALVDNPGLGEGDLVSLSNNPLSSDSINIYIPQLEARGVGVRY